VKRIPVGAVYHLVTGCFSLKRNPKSPKIREKINVSKIPTISYKYFMIRTG